MNGNYISIQLSSKIGQLELISTLIKGYNLYPPWIKRQRKILEPGLSGNIIKG